MSARQQDAFGVRVLQAFAVLTEKIAWSTLQDGRAVAFGRLLREEKP